MSALILSARNLEKKVYRETPFGKRGVRTLWHVDTLSIEQPGLFVLAGRNGAGKSTLLRCLLGLVHLDAGQVSWFGQPAVNQHMLGYVPEFPILPPTARVRHWLNWMIGKDAAHGASHENAFGLNTPGLSLQKLLDVPVHQLSKGQMQRVQLWTALAQKPRGLILDEPFSGLDPWARQELAALLLAVLETGTLVLMSTHDLPRSLRDTCTASWVLENGALTVQPGCAVPE